MVFTGATEKLEQERPLLWLSGSIPPDVPRCGFKNDNPVCLASKNAEAGLNKHTNMT